MQLGLGIGIGLNQGISLPPAVARADSTNYDVGATAFWGGYVYEAQTGGLGPNTVLPATWTLVGPDLSPNATFEDNGTDLLFYSDGSNVQARMFLDGAMTIGKTYQLEGTVTAYTGPDILFAIGHGSPVIFDGAGVKAVDLLCDAANVYIDIKRGFATGLDITVSKSSVSLKQKYLTGTGEPAFPGIGSTVVDGDITWLCTDVDDPMLAAINTFTVARASTRTVLGFAPTALATDPQTLITVPANIPAVVGGRLDGNYWNTRDVNGVLLPTEGINIGISGENSSTADDVASISMPSVLTAASGAIEAEFTLDDISAVIVYLSSYLDADNRFVVYTQGSNIRYVNNIGAVGGIIANEVFTPVVGTKFKIQMAWDTGTGLCYIRAANSADDISAAIFATGSLTTDGYLGASIDIGNEQGSFILKGTVDPQLTFYASASDAGWI